MSKSCQTNELGALMRIQKYEAKVQTYQIHYPTLQINLELRTSFGVFMRQWEFMSVTLGGASMIRKSVSAHK